MIKITDAITHSVIVERGGRFKALPKSGTTVSVAGGCVMISALRGKLEISYPRIAITQPIALTGAELTEALGFMVSAPTGGGGAGAFFYYHEQAVSSDVWLIPHGLNRFPTVDIRLTGGIKAFVKPEYLDSNNVRLTFKDGAGNAQGFSGVAYLV